MPSFSLVSYFNLFQVTEGIWIDPQGTIVALDASLLGYESCLLFEKDRLEEYLTKHGLSLFWKAYIEKVSDKFYHEWWILYEKFGEKYSYDLIDEGSGELKY